VQKEIAASGKKKKIADVVLKEANRVASRSSISTYERHQGSQKSQMAVVVRDVDDLAKEIQGNPFDVNLLDLSGTHIACSLFL